MTGSGISRRRTKIANSLITVDREVSVMRQLTGLAATSLSLVGLYLVLTKAAGSTAILNSLTAGTANIFRTLQGRG